MRWLYIAAAAAIIIGLVGALVCCAAVGRCLQLLAECTSQRRAAEAERQRVEKVRAEIWARLEEGR